MKKYFLDFYGAASSGKTTLMTMLSGALKLSGYSCNIIPSASRTLQGTLLNPSDLYEDVTDLNQMYITCLNLVSILTSPTTITLSTDLFLRPLIYTERSKNCGRNTLNVHKLLLKKLEDLKKWAEVVFFYLPVEIKMERDGVRDVCSEEERRNFDLTASELSNLFPESYLVAGNKFERLNFCLNVLQNKHGLENIK